jgi:predicted Rossmann fold flavoprotein
MALGKPVLHLAKSEEGFALLTPDRLLAAENVIVTTGGQSYPGCGTTGDGYAWLAAMGHTIVPPRPALTPLTTSASWAMALRGVTIPDVAVRVLALDDQPKPKCVAAERGSFLFTHFGLSGPAALNVSRAVTAHERPHELLLACDFLPAMRAEDMDASLRRVAATEGKKHVAGLVARWVPRRFADALVKQMNLSERTAAELSRGDRHRILSSLKETQIPLSGTRGFKKAEVTAGGIALDEVDSKTMQSKLVPNLYLAGEILDIDGPIGGYNFQAAFSTAWLAGSHV